MMDAIDVLIIALFYGVAFIALVGLASGAVALAGHAVRAWRKDGRK